MSCPQTDTIAAIATGAPGAIGIVRLSGPQAIAAAGRLFRPADGRPLDAHPPRSMVYGELTNEDGAVLDRIVATYSRAPASYTGEDTAELQCHGSALVLQLALEALFSCGVRQAAPGEFTRRAFLNGRMDLTQAEAVVDLIDAQTREGVLQSAGQLGGALSRRINDIYRDLLDLMAHFHAVLDWPDEDIDPFTRQQMTQTLDEAAVQLDRLLSTYRRGQGMVSGLPCAIVGRPNAGKSSLLNALLGYERAIVTDIPGTTRDTVEERVRLGGTLLRLVDTAGLRCGTDPVEQLGVARSRTAMEQAALILVVVDQSCPDEEDLLLLREAASLAPTILVWSKADLPKGPVPAADFQLPPAVTVSAKTGEGLDALEEQIAALTGFGGSDPCGTLLTNARQAEAGRRAAQSIELARQGLSDGFTPDAVLLDVENALSALGELTGQTVRQDITDRIFERFCVGK